MAINPALQSKMKSIHFINMIKNYRLKYLKSDSIAGLSVAAVSLPQVMAYALIAGLNPVYGIYTFIVSTIVATFTGVSNYMIVGPTNIIAVTIASTLSSLDIIDPGNYLQGVFILTLMAGLIQLVLGSMKLGNLVNYVSHSVIAGLTLGVALIIATGQLSKFLGLQIKSGHNVFESVLVVARNIQHIDHYSFLVGIFSIVIIILCKKFFPALPSYLLAIIISVFLVHIFNLSDNLALVGTIESSVPTFSMINFNFELVKKLFGSAMSIAIIGFIQVLSIVKAMEKKANQEAELNKEFIGQGLINIVCSFFNSFAITGSFTKSFANYEAGAKTRISELVSGLAVLLAVIIFKPVVSLIPISALAAIVMLVAFGMFDKEEIKKNFQTTKFDAIVFSVTFVMTILTPRLDYAVYFGIIVSLILVLRNTSHVDYSHISYDQKSENNFCRKKLEDVKNDKCIVINLAGPMHFNAAENLKKKLNKSFIKNKVFVIRMRDINSIDITAIQELDKFIDRVNKYRGEVIISGLRSNIYKCLAEYGIVDKIYKENIFRRNNDLFSSTKDAIERAENAKEVIEKKKGSHRLISGKD